MLIPVLLAVLGGLCVAVGVGVLSWPAGLITGGVELVAAAYVAAYLKARPR